MFQTALFQGDEVLTVSAFDGDYAHPRRIRYGLDPSGLAFSSYFSIDPDTGVLRVRKELQNVERRPTGPVILRLGIEFDLSHVPAFRAKVNMSNSNTYQGRRRRAHRRG